MDLMEKIMQAIREAMGSSVTMRKRIEELYKDVGTKEDEWAFDKILKKVGNHPNKPDVVRLRERMLEIKEEAKKIASYEIRKIFVDCELDELAEEFNDFVV